MPASFQPFPSFSIPFHSKMSPVLLRRSARLAAKGTGAPIKSIEIHIEEISSQPAPAPHTAREKSRAIFLANKGANNLLSTEKQACITILKRYLDDVDAARGKIAKAVLATCFMHYLIQIPHFLAAHTKFHEVAMKKMEEFKSDTIPDAVIAEDFFKAVEDVLFAYQV